MNAVLVRPILLDTIERMVRGMVGSSAETRVAPIVVDFAEGPLPAKVHALMQETTHQSLAAINASLSAGDWKGVLDQLHSLRGSFAMIREMDTADKVGKMEELAIAGNREALEAALQVFAGHASSVLDQRSTVQP